MGRLHAEECEDAGAACCPGVLDYNLRRVIYDVVDGRGDYVAPSVYTNVKNSRAPYGDPAIANVALHALTCRRRITAGGIEVPASFATEGATPPLGRSFVAPPFSGLSAFTVHRGSGPQYRVRFRDGTDDAVTLYVDGSTTLSWPASAVDIDLVTPPLALPVDTGLAGQGLPATYPAPTTPVDGEYVDSFAAASVSWSSRNAAPAAPGGMATWTQRTNATGVPPEGGPPLPIFFERPPFARRVQVRIESSVAGMLYQFMDGDLVIGQAAQGLVITAPALATSSLTDVPAHATHLRVTLPAGVPNGRRACCIWEIGVR